MQAGGMRRSAAETLMKTVVRLAGKALLLQSVKGGAKCFGKR
jgi:hypothetical protein